MRARHRLSKLLLRQGIVYSGGQAWTGTHDAWLRRQRFDAHALQMTFESDYDAVLTVKARRDRLDAAIATMAADSKFTAMVHRLGCLRGVTTLTGFALAVELVTGTASPATPSAPSSAWSPANTHQGPAGSRDRSPRPATPTCVGCSSRPPGTTAPAKWSARPCVSAGSWPAPQPALVAMRATAACTPAGTPSGHAASAT